ncbi:uncharacterized protein LOC143451669 isoform X1 [Clavelina lepadiformis]|uniref:uncharacterized protein LOC143451669 isoform X1 n=1 Tax=Clavelina lepadiformis TaxID=159417 RepID=UPI004042A872
MTTTISSTNSSAYTTANSSPYTSVYSSAYTAANSVVNATASTQGGSQLDPETYREEAMRKLMEALEENVGDKPGLALNTLLAFLLLYSLIYLVVILFIFRKTRWKTLVPVVTNDVSLNPKKPVDSTASQIIHKLKSTDKVVTSCPSGEQSSIPAGEQIESNHSPKQHERSTNDITTTGNEKLTSYPPETSEDKERKADNGSQAFVAQSPPSDVRNFSLSPKLAENKEKGREAAVIHHEEDNDRHTSVSPTPDESANSPFLAEDNIGEIYPGSPNLENTIDQDPGITTDENERSSAT